MDLLFMMKIKEVRIWKSIYLKEEIFHTVLGKFLTFEDSKKMYIYLEVSIRGFRVGILLLF